MTREQAINYMKSSGFSSETIAEITAALAQPVNQTKTCYKMCDRWNALKQESVDVLRGEIIDETIKGLLDNY